MRKIEELLQELHPDYDYGASEDFQSDGLLDSFDLQRLVAAMEQEYDVRLAGTDLLPQNFTNVETIRELLRGYGVERV